MLSTHNLRYNGASLSRCLVDPVETYRSGSTIVLTFPRISIRGKLGELLLSESNTDKLMLVIVPAVELRKSIGPDIVITCSTEGADPYGTGVVRADAVFRTDV